MSLWRRMLQAMGLGDSITDSTIIITDSDGVTVVNGTTVVNGVTIIDDKTIIVNGRQVKIDLGPEVERTFEATSPVSDAVRLSKEVSCLGLRLRNFLKAHISVQATDEVTAPVVTVTGPQKLLDCITSVEDNGFFDLALRQQDLASAFQVIAEVIHFLSSFGDLPRVQVHAKVPIGAALSLKDCGGTVKTNGTLGDIDAKLAYGTKLDGDIFDGVTINTGQNSQINIGSMNGTLAARLAYGTTLYVCAGTVSDCEINTGQNSRINIDASSGTAKIDLGYGTKATLAHVVGDLEANTGQHCQVSVNGGDIGSVSAKLGYESKLYVKSRVGASSVNTGQNSQVEFGIVANSVNARLAYGTHFTVSDGQQLDSVKITAGQNCKLRLSAGSIRNLELDLGYGGRLDTAASVDQASVKTGQNSKLYFTKTEAINSLKATLSYGTTLNCSGSVLDFRLDTGQNCQITVAGDVNKGSLRTAYGTKVRAHRVSPGVDTRGMSKQSELIITG